MLADNEGPDQTAQMHRLIWPSLSACARRHVFAWHSLYINVIMRYRYVSKALNTKEITTRQPLRVILCRLPEKGRKEIEEIVEEMKAGDREERGTGMKVKKQKK